MNEPIAADLDQNFLASWWAVFRRRWLVSGVVFVVVFGLGATLVLTARPVYRADAKLRIGEPPPSPGVSAGTSIFGLMRLGGDPFANDLELLGSRTVIEGMVRDAVLNVTVTAPKGWHRDSLFAALSTGDSTPRATFEARWTTTDRIAVRQLSPVEASIGEFAAGAPAQFAGVQAVFRQRKPGGPEKITLTTIPINEAVRRSASRVSFARTRRDANVVQLIAADPDPAIASTAVKSTLSRFIELRTSIQKRESTQNIDSLRAVARETQAELLRAESALEAMQREARLVSPDLQSRAFVDRYTELSAALEETRGLLRAIQSVRANTAETPGERWSKLLAYPAFRENEAMGQMLNQLTGLERQRSLLANRRTEQNLEYRVVLDQIAYIDRSLASLASDMQTTLSEGIQRQETLLKEMDGTLAGIPSQTIDLARRQRAARILSEVLVLTEQRLRQEELRQALTFANIQVIDPTALRWKPIWPRKKLGLLVAWMIAGFSALMTMIATERADRRLRRAADVMRITGAPVLGVAVRGPAGLRFSTGELNAVVHHASVNGRGPLRILVAPVGHAHANELIGVLRLALPAPVAAGASGGAEVVEAANIVDFASASSVALGQIPVTMVIEAGKTTRDELIRATTLVRQAGGSIGGTVVVGTARAADDVWA